MWRWPGRQGSTEEGSSLPGGLEVFRMRGAELRFCTAVACGAIDHATPTLCDPVGAARGPRMESISFLWCPSPYDEAGSALSLLSHGPLALLSLCSRVGWWSSLGSQTPPTPPGEGRLLRAATWPCAHHVTLGTLHWHRPSCLPPPPGKQLECRLRSLVPSMRPDEKLFSDG